MSYILEALKKSQQERELGRVPTLETTGTFEDDKVVPDRSRGPILAVGLAAVAMIVALYAALRAPGSTPASAPPPVGVAEDVGPTPGGGPAAARSGHDLASVQTPPRLGVAPAPPIGQEAGPKASGRQAPASNLAPVPPRAAPKEPATNAAGQAAEPLIEPPPLKQTERLPPSRVVEDRASQPWDLPLSDGPDDEAEMEMQRQMEAEYIEPWEEEYADPAPTPVPRDLIADIESFKREVRSEPSAEKVSAKAQSKPTQSKTIAENPESLRLTPAQEAALPSYLMTVHVYDNDPSRRFVLINGRKYREGDETREAMRVEQILAQGAILSHKGNPFFVHR